MNSSLNLYNKKQLETSNLWVNGNINLNFKYCIIGFPFKPQIKKLTWAFLLSKKKKPKTRDARINNRSTISRQKGKSKNETAAGLSRCSWA